MEQEKTVGKDGRVNTLRAKKEVALQDAIRKIVKEEFKNSERMPAIDLAREKMEENVGDVNVELIRTDLTNGQENRLVETVKKYAAKLLKSPDKHSSVTEISDAFTKDQDLGMVVNYIETNGKIPACVIDCDDIFETLIRIKENKFVQLFWSQL